MRPMTSVDSSRVAFMFALPPSYVGTPVHSGSMHAARGAACEHLAHRQRLLPTAGAENRIEGTVWRPYHLSESSPAMNANRSQSTCERVSVRGDKICRERVCASQRPGGVLAPRFVLSHRRDRNRRSGQRECRGKPGVLSETAGNRICAGLGGGRTRIRTLDPLIKSPLC
jgi:hypothetical protein